MNAVRQATKSLADIGRRCDLLISTTVLAECGAEPLRQSSYRKEHVMRKVLRGYAKDRDGNLIQIGTLPLPHSKDKRSPRERQDKRDLIRQGATIFKKEIVR
jgi:hypothetical protein